MNKYSKVNFIFFFCRCRALIKTKQHETDTEFVNVDHNHEALVPRRKRGERKELIAKTKEKKTTAQ